MPFQQPDIIVTTALNYANGSLHLGHMLEDIQADIWVRFMRLTGHHCLFVSGNDAHGTPIMLSAEKRNISPEDMVASIHDEHQRDIKDFHIDFDHFYTTHSNENKHLVEHIYSQLKLGNHIETKTISQAFDDEKNMFLPDRYIKGQCPYCKSEEQYGDNCETCGQTYQPMELINPYSILSGSKPSTKKSEHYFFKLEHFQGILETWINQGELQDPVSNKLKEWFDQGLQSWDISRDAPYFGFKIPECQDKYFYVWLDAPVGYMSTIKHLCQSQPELDFDAIWNPNSEVSLYHFIGKDIMYFHGLFWPALLHGANYRLPSAIYAHGFLTINNEKMSKSRGTFITAREYLDHLNPEFLRYYFASKLQSGVDDIDLNIDDFVQKVNSDLIGKVINIASRCAKFINNDFQSTLSARLHQPQMWQDWIDSGKDIALAYQERRFHQAIQAIMQLADQANRYIADQQPWKLIKNPEQKDEAHAVCSMGLHFFRMLMLYLQPVIPATSKKAFTFLQVENLHWQNRSQLFLGHSIQPYQHILERIQPKDLPWQGSTPDDHQEK
jgi:methionyl-tRNA synthetase